ncbi:MAG TPA: protocatechuate 3,4-dioxygenase [Gammaproteobacteria bacterium]|jgi:protocatechuate 4,5-dioxygenase, beta chain|uniref:DODA-type extradiol aromatic ring-opening family dioxygenase n=1 Tax=Immundisolibacter sp. TaxID=1934948 RepID=UPI000E7D58B7|nr:protocatechuate 3,4-dioxygenase [Gammaproteobacteria bacterium]HCZ49408.1 protocatechuate 3,4-dioxygenase [Gammaproteobacteria bacterium]MCH78846.1 protocatechuate 3,4-dioxygenase [Gammaproteobacteria bacterium]
MAQIVGGFVMPHDPLITGNPEIADQNQVEKVNAAFARVVERVKELKADTAIVIGDDHFTMFGPHCLPQYLIGIGDIEGPEENWLRMERRQVPNNAPLAEHIMNFGFERGFDWAVAKSLVLDHGTMIPIHMAATPAGLRTIPIYTAAGVTPLLRTKRAKELGQMIGEAVAAFPGDERVVVYGTGGISHWVGTAEMGRVNEEFDRLVLGMVERGDIDGLVNLSDEYVIEHGGNGALEIRNWIVAMAAMPADVRGELLVYEPMPPWITGIGIAELKLAA